MSSFPRPSSSADPSLDYDLKVKLFSEMRICMVFMGRIGIMALL